MRKSIVILVALMLLTVSYAQSQQLKVASQGDKAVLFTFSGLNNLGASLYQGGFGMKYFMADKVALRGMLIVGADDKTTKTTPETTDDGLTIGIGCAIEYHLSLASSVSPYIGGGIFYQYSSETQDPGSYKSTANNLGLGALIGVEYFFNQNLSLSAEYQFGLSSASSTAPESPDQSELKIGFHTLDLTLSVYF